jgi:hypothetical protein
MPIVPSTNITSVSSLFGCVECISADAREMYTVAEDPNWARGVQFARLNR